MRDQRERIVQGIRAAGRGLGRGVAQAQGQTREWMRYPSEASQREERGQPEGITQMPPIQSGRMVRQGCLQSVEAGRQMYRQQKARQLIRTGSRSISWVERATQTAARCTATSGKALWTVACSGGGAAMAVVLVICLLAGVLLTPLGIFFEGEGPGKTIPQVVGEINGEYQQRVEQLRKSEPHLQVKMTGARASWRDILAVYTVKETTSTDIANPIYFLDEERESILRGVFWDMNRLHSQTTEEGGEKVLCIQLIQPSLDEVSRDYGFGPQQVAMLQELLSEAYEPVWNTLLVGGNADQGAFVAVALSQVGNVGGEPYWSWYGFSSRVEWCACFVSWCANQCGYLEDEVLPRFAGCIQGSNWFKARDRWQDRTYVPNPGDIIFFDWTDDEGPDGLCDHVGIVERVAGGRVYTVEGNSGDMCRNNSYPLGYFEIYGYGTIAVK